MDKPGWRRFKQIAKQQGKIFHEVSKTKIQNHVCKPKFKYGIEIPCNYLDAIRLDVKNCNTLWQDANHLEMEHMTSYTVFKDTGKHAPVPEGYKNICVHLVFDVKHDGRHRACLVVDGHLNDIPIDSIYSGVVSLRGFCLLLFLAELNGL